MMFVPHMLLDAYAFNRAEMFDRNPTTSRAAERTAIDDLADPIVALAPDRHVVRLNPAAESLLGVDAETARDRPLDEFMAVPGLDDDRAAAAERTGATATTTAPARRSRSTTARPPHAAVSTSTPPTDPPGTHVGYTIVFSDVTERERRRQQLEVLNRILRHNLRNDAGVVHGYGDPPQPPRGSRAGPDGRRDRAPRGALAALGEKAGTVERLVGDSDASAVAVDEIVASAIADAHERDPDASVESNPVDGDHARVRVDALRAIVENTVENALDHHDGEGSERDDGGPWVRVSLRREGKEREKGKATRSTTPGSSSPSRTTAPASPITRLRRSSPAVRPRSNTGRGLGAVGRRVGRRGDRRRRRLRRPRAARDARDGVDPDRRRRESQREESVVDRSKNVVFGCFSRSGCEGLA